MTDPIVATLYSHTSFNGIYMVPVLVRVNREVFFGLFCFVSCLLN